jgi:hypothetical protein
MIAWSNQIGHRGRRKWALLVANGKVFPFEGKTVDGVVAVMGTSYEQAGKWSHTTFRLELAPGIRFISGCDGWETGRFLEGLKSATHADVFLDTWPAVANALGVAIPECRRFLEAFSPASVEALDAAEAALESVDKAAEGNVAELALSFGGPTRRERDNGYWDWPVIVEDASGLEIGRVVPDNDPCVGWRSPQTLGPIGLIGVEKTAGHGGGYVSLRVAVPEGSILKHKMP